MENDYGPQHDGSDASPFDNRQKITEFAPFKK